MIESLNLRIIHTHDTADNWDKIPEFVPKLGELIIYDVDTTHVYERFKIGDGKTKLSDLPFTVESVVYSMFSVQDNLVCFDAGRITQYDEIK